MGEVVNLRQARKAKARDDKARVADENRARHGRTKAEKQLDCLSAEKSTTFIEGHKRATPTSPSTGLRGRSSDRASGSIVGREGRGDCGAIGVPGGAPPPGPASGRPEDRLRGAGGGGNASPNHTTGNTLDD